MTVYQDSMGQWVCWGQRAGRIVLYIADTKEEAIKGWERA